MKNEIKSYRNYSGPSENIDRSTVFLDGYYIMAMLKDGSGPYNIGISGPVLHEHGDWSKIFTIRKEGSSEVLSPLDLDID